MKSKNTTAKKTTPPKVGNLEKQKRITKIPPSVKRKQAKPEGVVPKLRFPEFRDAWAVKKLGNVAELIDKRAGDNKYTLMSVTSGVGLVSQIAKFGREIAGNQYKNYFVIKKWDFAYNKSSTKKYPEGYISMLMEQVEAAVPNSIFTCFRIVDKNTLPHFLDYLFHDNLHGKWLGNFIEVGARAHGSLSIGDEDLFRMPIAFPTFEEQKKIADFLTSLDSLISAESQKLDTLKEHKNGLMQNLFPAESETVPKLRFPEFRRAGDWVEKKLGDVGVIVSGLTYSPDDIDDNGVLVLRSSNVQDSRLSFDDNVYVQSNSFNPVKENDILICVRNGSRNLLGKNAIITKEFEGLAFGAFMSVYRSKYNKFLIHWFSSEKFYREVNQNLGATINSINGGDLKKFAVLFPSISEQQKIANSLSSLDNLITAQSQKIAALKSHKKGLMQQLFPTANEVKS